MSKNLTATFLFKCLLLTALVCYLIGSATFWNLNPVEWSIFYSSVGRLLLYGSTAFAYLAVFSLMKDNK